MSDVLFLRPHHCLCIILYNPKGHSSPYTEIMYSIIDALTNNPYQLIELSISLDIICGYCPHNHMGSCRKSEEVKQSDESCMKFCGLNSNQKIPWIELKHCLINNVLNVNKLEQTCVGCQYLTQCKKMNEETKGIG